MHTDISALTGGLVFSTLSDGHETSTGRTDGMARAEGSCARILVIPVRYIPLCLFWFWFGQGIFSKGAGFVCFVVIFGLSGSAAIPGLVCLDICLWRVGLDRYLRIISCTHIVEGKVASKRVHSSQILQLFMRKCDVYLGR